MKNEKFIFNVDFETQIFQGKSDPRWRKSVEFLFFWVEDTALVTSIEYSNDYRKYISSYTGVEPQTTPNIEGAFNWWGDLNPIELMKTINSKKFSYFLSKELNHLPEYSYFLESAKDLEKINLNLQPKWILKSLDGVSGKGHRRIQAHENVSHESLLFPSILEAEMNRYKDLGAYYLPFEDRFIYYENNVDTHFQYKGTILGEGDQDELHLDPDEKVHLIHYDEFLHKIKNKIQKLGYSEGFSVDSFFYKNAMGEVKFYPLTEINCRKTMGYMAYLLKKKFQSKWIYFFIIPQKKIILNWQEMMSKSTRDILILSPEDTNLSWHCSLGDSAQSVKDKKLQWENKITSDVIPS